MQLVSGGGSEKQEKAEIELARIDFSLLFNRILGSKYWYCRGFHRDFSLNIVLM